MYNYTKLYKGLNMLEQTLALIRERNGDRKPITISIPVWLRECVDEMAEKEKTNFTNILISALTVLCHEYEMGSFDIITRERAKLWNLLIKKQDELRPLLGNLHDKDGFEHRGFWFSNEDLNWQDIDILIDQIEALEKALNLDPDDLERKDLERS